MGAAASYSNKLKATAGVFNAARNKYNDESIEEIKKTDADILFYTVTLIIQPERTQLLSFSPVDNCVPLPTAVEQAF